MDTIIYRAHRLRFIITAMILLPITIGIAALGYLNTGSDDNRGLLTVILIITLYVWLDFMLVAKLIWPPEIHISTRGIQLKNRALLVSGSYSWGDIEGPALSAGAYGVPLMEMTVKATGKKIRMPPSHFGATYEELADVIGSARAGRLIHPLQWQRDHPQHKLHHWLKDWGFPLLLGAGVGVALIVLRR